MKRSDYSTIVILRDFIGPQHKVLVNTCIGKCVTYNYYCIKNISKVNEDPSKWVWMQGFQRVLLMLQASRPTEMKCLTGAPLSSASPNGSQLLLNYY